MRMIGLLLIFGGLAVAQAPPPAQSDQSPSLGDAARQAREKQAAAPKATKTFDNNSLKQAPPESVPAAKAPAAKPAKPADTKPPVDLEKKYRAQFAKLRSELKAAQAEDKRLHALLERASPNNPVNGGYLNPGVVKRLHDGIAANDAKILGFKTALEDLSEELRKKGLPASWGFE
jgi:hypothetical protein